MPHVCEKCLKKIYDNGYARRFPTFTISGGLLGIVGGILINPILAPIGIGMGVAADAVKCRLCGCDENLVEVDIKTDRWGRPVVFRAPLKQFEERKSLEDDTFDFELENQQPQEPDTQFSLEESDLTDAETSIESGDSALDIDAGFDVGDAGFGDADGSDGPSGGGEK
jgi:hypothetical protein